MVLSNGWIETDDPEKLTKDNICSYCKADEEECGEWRECCYSQAIKEAEWEKTKEEVKVGDVYRSEAGNYFAIRNTDGEKGVAKILFMSNGEVTPDYIKSYCTKTGRHIDIDSFLKQIGGEQE